ncbi:MAG: hypothetical protein AAGB46_04225 [Verrucomicrobiota bacterium]
MNELWQNAKNWFLSLGTEYGVDPIIFGAIYVGAIPFFTLSVAWLVNNVRKKKPIALPTISSGFFFISAYLYLLIAGRNIPWWVYAIVAFILIYGSYSSYQSIRKKLKKAEAAA